jgi:PAS domain S-box-containing protein
MTHALQEELGRAVLWDILNNLPTPIFVKDQDLKFVFTNKQYQDIVGKTEDELLGHLDADFYEADALQDYIAVDRRVIDHGELVIVEEINARKDGLHVPVQTRKARVTDETGKHFLIGTVVDVTAIKKREEQYRALSETVPVGVLQVNESGEIAFANPLALAYLNRGMDNLHFGDLCRMLGQSCDVFPGQAARFECQLKNHTGAVRHVLVISSGWLRLTKDKSRSALLSIVDVTENSELKRINEDILRLNQELAINMQKLKEAQDALVKKGRMEQMGQLTATIAHELRNPLGAVRTSAFLVERKLKGKGIDVELQLQRINNGVMRCDNIITQLLDFSRSKKLSCDSQDLDKWLQGIVEEECKNLPSTINITCELGLGDVLVPFDAARLQRAVVNLLSNAAEALVGNGTEPLLNNSTQAEIKISTACRGDEIALSVADNGIGMTPEILEKIREPLFTTKSFGTGLGIPAIEQIASQHGGRLEVTSDIGQGAVFTLFLPRIQVEEVAA